MLEPIQRDGTQPPLVMIHGLYGVMPIGHPLSRVLGPEQPLYAINAWGFGSAAPPFDSIPAMAADYAGQIRRARPAGPYLVGGICSGGLLALEVARALIATGEPVGRVLLVDPPALPFSYDDQLHQLESNLQPGVAHRLREQVLAELREYATRYEYLPYDARDEGSMQRAADVGVACMLAFFKHRPLPFAAAVELIVSDRRAAGHFGPTLPWQSILTGPRWIHVLPGIHGDMFRAHSDAVFRLISFYLETALTDAESSAAGETTIETVAQSA